MEREIIKLNKMTLPWTVKTLVSSMKKGTAIFDNACQRSLVWTNEQKSMLIHSLIIGAPIPPMYCSRNSETKVYDFLDGKQRSNAIFDYVEGNFTLEGVPELEYDDESTVDINGKLFKELDEELQDAIRTYSLSIVYFDDLTDEQESDIFYRLNSGSALTAIEKSRVLCPSLETIQRIANESEVIQSAVTEKAKAKYVDEDLVIKSFAMLKMEEPCLDTKVIRPFTQNLELDEDDVEELTNILNRLATIHDNIEDTKVAKKLYGRTHLVTLVGFLATHDEDEDEEITEMLSSFFDGGRAGTTSDKYNAFARSGSGHAPNIKGRLEILEEEFENYK